MYWFYFRLALGTIAPVSTQVMQNTAPAFTLGEQSDVEHSEQYLLYERQTQLKNFRHK